MDTQNSTSHSECRAHPGDRLVIKRRSLGARERDAEIIDVLGESGAPPFRVRWQDDGHESEIFPGADAYIEHLNATNTV